MRAVVCNAFEGIKALNLAEAPEPNLAADEVLIDVHAAPVSGTAVLSTSAFSRTTSCMTVSLRAS